MGTWRNLGRSKYGAHATVTAGIRFHSKAEAARYKELVLLQKAGEIRELELQPAFPLHVGQKEVAILVADFQYREAPDWVLVVEDCKGLKYGTGLRTPLYKLKAKILFAEYGIRIRET
jgi:hypothetical protein